MPTANPALPVRAENSSVFDALLAIADTKLVLGNWYVSCLFNAKSLLDYSALLAMSAASFGHTRALYDYLAVPGREFAWLERGRGADQIHSLGALDEAPRHWQDFIAALYVAEQASWLQVSRFLNDTDRPLAALTRRIGEEAYFHLKYAQGWFVEFARDESVARRARDALLHRYRQALAWFPDGAGDPLRESFVRSTQESLETLGQPGLVPGGADRRVHGAAAPLRRAVAIPERLYEIVRFKDPGAAP